MKSRIKYIVVFVFYTFWLVAQDTTSIDLLPVEIRTERSYTPSKISLSRSHFLSAPASFDDPSRLLMKYPGFSVSNDQNNAIIYDGLPSHYSTWSLYGAQIVNPNHLSNAGTANDRPSRSSGGVNMFSGQVIGGLDYHTSADGPAHGIGGVADLSLRSPFENSITANLSLIGLETGFDKIFDNGRSSLMANYRYSTVGLLGHLGVDFGNELINYQDILTEYKHRADDHCLNWSLVIGNSNNSLDSIASFGELDIEFKDILNVDYTAQNIVSALNYVNKDLEGTVAYSVSKVDRNASYIFNDTLRFSEYMYDESVFSLFAKKKFKAKPIDVIIQLNASRIAPNIRSRTSEDIKRNGIQIQGISFYEGYWIIQPQLQLRKQINENNQVLIGLQSWLTTYEVYSSFQQLKPNRQKWLPHILFKSKIADVEVELNTGMSAQMQAPELLGIYGGDNLTQTGGLYNNRGLRPLLSKYVKVDVSKGNYGLSLHHRTIDDVATAVSQETTSLGALNKIGINRYRNSGIATISGLSLFGSHTFGNTKLSTNANFLTSTFSSFNDSPVPYDYGQMYNISIERIFRFNNNKSLRISSSYHTRKGFFESRIDEVLSTEKFQLS